MRGQRRLGRSRLAQVRRRLELAEVLAVVLGRAELGLRTSGRLGRTTRRQRSESMQRCMTVGGGLGNEWRLLGQLLSGMLMRSLALDLAGSRLTFILFSLFAEN